MCFSEIKSSVYRSNAALMNVRKWFLFFQSTLSQLFQVLHLFFFVIYLNMSMFLPGAWTIKSSVIILNLTDMDPQVPKDKWVEHQILAYLAVLRDITWANNNKVGFLCEFHSENQDKLLIIMQIVWKWSKMSSNTHTHTHTLAGKELISSKDFILVFQNPRNQSTDVKIWISAIFRLFSRQI